MKDKLERLEDLIESLKWFTKLLERNTLDLNQSNVELAETTNPNIKIMMAGRISTLREKHKEHIFTITQLKSEVKNLLFEIEKELKLNE